MTLTHIPHLLDSRGKAELPDSLISDLQLDKVLSARAISVLRKPCDREEIARRNELFALLDDEENAERMKKVLSVLSAGERSLRLRRDAGTALERYHRYAEALDCYVDSSEILASMTDFGSLFANVAAYFSAEPEKAVAAEMKESVKRIRELLEPMRTGLLSFADKSWLTPDRKSVSEADLIAECAKKLGFGTPKRKSRDTKISQTLSDAICRLYADKVARIEAEIAKCATVDLYEPTVYIAEIKFFSEIRELWQKAIGIDVPHCIAKIANEPLYRAGDLYDISLLAKKCGQIVPNDANFDGKERFCFLTGANGGGKTAYLRAVGINLVLFLAGCPVFAKSAEFYPFEIVLSHFPKDERFDDTGRFDEERKRTEEMLKAAENKSAFFLFNETFGATDDKQGFEQVKNLTAKIRENGYFGLYVTHFHEVMSLDEPILSAEVDSAADNRRTYCIVGSKGSASSYAADILKKYRLDKDSLEARGRESGN